MVESFSKRGEKNRVRRQEALSAYLDGELSARERTRIEQELAQDPALRAELAELRRTVQMIRSLPTLAVPRSFTLDPVVYGRTKPRRIHLYPVMRAATVVAMVLFVFLVTSSLLPQKAMAPAADVAMHEVEVTREVEKEFIVVETVEVAEEAPVELAAEPPAAEALPMMEAPAEPLAETVAEVEEEVLAEAEPVEATQEQMPTAAAVSSDIVPSATPVPLSEGGVGAAAPSPSVEVSPTAELAPAPTMAAVARAVEESEAAAPEATVPEAPSPEVITAAEEPRETLLPEAAPAEPLEKAQEAEPDQARLRQVDWSLVARWGAGLLVAGLLVVTLLARRFGW